MPFRPGRPGAESMTPSKSGRGGGGILSKMSPSPKVNQDFTSGQQAIASKQNFNNIPEEQDNTFGQQDAFRLTPEELQAQQTGPFQAPSFWDKMTGAAAPINAANMQALYAQQMAPFQQQQYEKQLNAASQIAVAQAQAELENRTALEQGLKSQVAARTSQAYNDYLNTVNGQPDLSGGTQQQPSITPIQFPSPLNDVERGKRLQLIYGETPLAGTGSPYTGIPATQSALAQNLVTQQHALGALPLAKNAGYLESLANSYGNLNSANRLAGASGVQHLVGASEGDAARAQAQAGQAEALGRRNFAVGALDNQAMLGQEKSAQELQATRIASKQAQDVAAAHLGILQGEAARAPWLSSSGYNPLTGQAVNIGGMRQERTSVPYIIPSMKPGMPPIPTGQYKTKEQMIQVPPSMQMVHPPISAEEMNSVPGVPPTPSANVLSKQGPIETLGSPELDKRLAEILSKYGAKKKEEKKK